MENVYGEWWYWVIVGIIYVTLLAYTIRRFVDFQTDSRVINPLGPVDTVFGCYCLFTWHGYGKQILGNHYAAIYIPFAFLFLIGIGLYIQSIIKTRKETEHE